MHDNRLGIIVKIDAMQFSFIEKKYMMQCYIF